MKSKNNISKVDRNISKKHSQYFGSWFVFSVFFFSLVSLHVWAVEAQESENNDTEVEQSTVVPTENTDDSSSTISVQQNDEIDKAPVEVTKEVITGTSDNMERNEKDGVTIFFGNAKTKRHTEDGVEIGFLNADTITIKTDLKTNETTEIVAVGNVEIRDDKIFATCDHATLDNLTSIITLKDNVVVLKNKDRLETKLFTFNRITGKQTGIGGVKFKVAVTQTTPTETAEETEADNKDATESSGNPDKKTDSSETKKEEQKESNGNSDKSDSKEKTAPIDGEKVESESEEDSDTENTQSEDDSDTENTQSEESEQGETEESESEVTDEDTQE